MAKLWRIALPILILLAAYWISQYLQQQSPQAQRRSEPEKPSLLVDVQTLESQSYQLMLTSYGNVQAHTQLTLTAEVAGTITYLSENFREGSYFEQGELLARIDPADYQNAVTIARSELSQQQLALAEEQARAAQAERDWQRLGDQQPANALVLRKPQQAAQQAAVASAKARLAQAERDLQRTEVRAPFAGRVLDKQVELNQYVNRGEALASSFAVDYLEVRLPLSLEQQQQVVIPEQFRAQTQSHLGEPAKVEIIARLGEQRFQWPARLVRSEAVLDSRSRQLYVLAQIDDPYGPAFTQQPSLKLGQFVEAQIYGKQLEEVFVIPHTSLYPNQQVLVFHDGQVSYRKVALLWQDPEHYVVRGELQAGEQLVTTPLGQVLEGSRAQLRAN